MLVRRAGCQVDIQGTELLGDCGEIFHAAGTEPISPNRLRIEIANPHKRYSGFGGAPYLLGHNLREGERPI